MIVGLKLGRRLLAASAFDAQRFVFQSSRYVATRKGAVEPGLAKYLTQLFDQLRPTAVYYFAPAASTPFMQVLIALLAEQAATAGVPLKPLSRLDIFGSFGITPLRTRGELREALLPLAPMLSEGKDHRQTALAEATAAALIGDLWQRWPPL